MTISGRIARHLRAHIVGYLALFVALSGTAIALPGKKSVKSDDLAPGAVKAKAIKAKAVTNAKLRDGAVTSTKIADGTVIGADLGNAVVTDAKLADGSVVRAKIRAGAVNAGKLANGSVNSAKVNDGSLQAVDFAPDQLSAGFVAETDPATFALPRRGRLFVNATLVATCPSSCTYAVTVDGATVPGTTLTTGATTSEQLTLTGVTDPLGAGDRTLDIAVTGGPTVAQPTIAGVLLQ